jgi:hypothetical protein
MKKCMRQLQNLIWEALVETIFGAGAPKIVFGGGGLWGALVEMLKEGKK